MLRLQELWLHTGTACNLSCPFCHEGSKPGDARLQAPALAELAPVIDAAVAHGVDRIAFTGGEPLILKDILAVLAYALQRRPVLVLTNGTAPFIRRAHQLAALRTLPNPLSFRVSIDHPDEARHDAGRGFRNFRKALEGLRLLHVAGFDVGITRQQLPGENARAVDSRFRNLLRKQNLPEDLSIVALPELGALGDLAGLPEAPAHDPPLVAPETACARSRMVLKRDGALRIAPCPLVDDDPSFDMPGGLEDALTRPIRASHPRCALCLGAGVNYIGTVPTPGV
jgi:sulfatase maturation enzyme AslB (radical SAM superfamily)